MFKHRGPFVPLLMLFTLAVLFLAPSQASACVQGNRSLSISSSITLDDTDLSCDCFIFIHIATGSTVTITLPPAGKIEGWNPAIVITADNTAVFTVVSETTVLLNGFTTRGGVVHNDAAGKWVRFQ
jgi:hypothetical protein